MKIQEFAKDDAIKSLATSESGLSLEEAKRRLIEFGPNEIKEAPKRSLLLRFLSHLSHFLAILLWIAAVLSFISEYLNPGQGMLTLGFTIIAVIFINAIFTFIQEYRAERALEELKKLLPFRVKVIREGSKLEIPSFEVVPGDIIVLSEGDKIPADARLIEAVSLKVNNAPLTGESEPVLRVSEPFKGDLIESPNIVFAGTSVLSGTGRAVVFATGMGTEFGKIAHLTSKIEPSLSPLQREIIKMTRLIALIATLMGLVFFLIGYLSGRSFWENYLFAIGIIVANVPEGLLPTVTLALAIGSKRMAQRNALIKTFTSVETLGSVTVICTDKTGTLTQNQMSVKDIWLPEVGSVSQKEPPAKAILEIALLCNNASYSMDRYIGDPTEIALLKVAEGLKLKAERLSEIPFDPERKKMTTIDRVEGRLRAHTKGAPESILSLCSKVLIDGTEHPLTDEISKKVKQAYSLLMDRGLRGLAFAYKDLSSPKEDAERDMVFVGLMGLEDPPRPEVPEAIKKCKEAGIRIIMITGDSTRTAIAIGREIGLFNEMPEVIEGHEFEAISDLQLKRKLSKDIVFSRMTPKHKLRIVSILKEDGHRVAVTGDGVNDAPALKGADIGISMGILGTDVAKEASDIVLLDDNFASIVNAVEEGRAVYENIRKFLSYILASNIPEIVPYIAYVLFGIPLPLTILQILAVDLGTDMLPALALGAERPTPKLMKKPPRSLKEKLLNLRLLARSYLFLGPVEATAAMFGFFYVLFSGGWIWAEYLAPNNPLYMQATTACLTAIIITQIGNVFACRSWDEPISSIGFFSNKMIFWGILVEVLIQLFIVYHPWGNLIFSTTPMPLKIWLLLMPFAVALFAFEEIRKSIARRL